MASDKTRRIAAALALYDAVQGHLETLPKPLVREYLKFLYEVLRDDR